MSLKVELGSLFPVCRRWLGDVTEEEFYLRDLTKLSDQHTQGHTDGRVSEAVFLLLHAALIDDSIVQATTGVAREFNTGAWGSKLGLEAPLSMGNVLTGIGDSKAREVTGRLSFTALREYRVAVARHFCEVAESKPAAFWASDLDESEAGDVISHHFLEEVQSPVRLFWLEDRKTREYLMKRAVTHHHQHFGQTIAHLAEAGLAPNI